MTTMCGRDYKQPKQIAIPIGNVNPSGNGMNGQVYYANGISPSVTTNKGEGNKIGVPVGFNTMSDGSCRTIKHQYQKNSIANFTDTGDRGATAVCVPVLTPDRENKRQNGRRFKENGDPAFTLTAQDKHGVALGVLRNTRSDYGKEIRKDYEAGNVDISRHEFLEHEIREDGISNTIDSVQKDNYLAICVEEKGTGEEDHPGIYVELYEGCTVYAVWYEKYECYIAIRKLTPKETFRLQGWTDDYFEKAAFVNSNSQLYKQAGNGVTVNVVYEIGNAINEFSTKKGESQ